MSLDRFAADVDGIPLAWKRLEETLARVDPKLLATLNPPLALREGQRTTITWYAGHDGQSERARPLFREFRLLTREEGKRAWDRHRGDSYRPDWDDQWKVLGRAKKTRLLCFEEITTSVYEVDVSVEPYKKARICFGMSKWLALAEKSLRAKKG